MAVLGHWRGTEQEAKDLMAAIVRNCTCQGHGFCSAHAMLNDERVLMHLLWARHLAATYVVEEWDAETRS